MEAIRLSLVPFCNLSNGSSDAASTTAAAVKCKSLEARLKLRPDYRMPLAHTKQAPEKRSSLT